MNRDHKMQRQGSAFRSTKQSGTRQHVDLREENEQYTVGSPGLSEEVPMDATETGEPWNPTAVRWERNQLVGYPGAQTSVREPKKAS